MRLKSGSHLGPYEILVPLGAGGMGEVYRARDSRLGRDVEIGDPVRLFEAELRPSGLNVEYCVSADGQRLLINRMLHPRGTGVMTLDQNWSSDR